MFAIVSKNSRDVTMTSHTIPSQRMDIGPLTWALSRMAPGLLAASDEDTPEERARQEAAADILDDLLYEHGELEAVAA